MIFMVKSSGWTRTHIESTSNGRDPGRFSPAFLGSWADKHRLEVQLLTLAYVSFGDVVRGC